MISIIDIGRFCNKRIKNVREPTEAAVANRMQSNEHIIVLSVQCQRQPVSNFEKVFLFPPSGYNFIVLLTQLIKSVYLIKTVYQNTSVYRRRAIPVLLWDVPDIGRLGSKNRNMNFAHQRSIWFRKDVFFSRCWTPLCGERRQPRKQNNERVKLFCMTLYFRQILCVVTSKCKILW